MQRLTFVGIALLDTGCASFAVPPQATEPEAESLPSRFNQDNQAS